MDFAIIHWLAAGLIGLGAIFAVIAAIGVLRMPDMFCRMHAGTKAGAFGASLLVAGSVLEMGTLRSVIQGLLIIVFFYLTAPVAAQMIGRGGYLRGAALWHRSFHDALEGREPYTTARARSIQRRAREAGGGHVGPPPEESTGSREG